MSASSGGPSRSQCGDALALAELGRQRPQLAVDEREEDRHAGRPRRSRSNARDEAVDRGHARVPHERRRVRRELRLGGPRHARGGVAGRVGDQVDLDRVGASPSALHLGEVADAAADVGHVDQQPEAVGTHGDIIGHHEDGVEEGVDRLAQATRRARAARRRCAARAARDRRRRARASLGCSNAAGSIARRRLVGALGRQPVAARERVLGAGERRRASTVALQRAGRGRRTPRGRPARRRRARRAPGRSRSPSAASTASTRSSTNCSTASTVSAAPSASCAPWLASSAWIWPARSARRRSSRRSSAIATMPAAARRSAVRVARAGRPLADRRAWSRARRACRPGRAGRRRGLAGGAPPARVGQELLADRARDVVAEALGARVLLADVALELGELLHQRRGLVGLRQPRRGAARRVVAAERLDERHDALRACRPAEPARAWNVMRSRSAASASSPRWRSCADARRRRRRAGRRSTRSLPARTTSSRAGSELTTVRKPGKRRPPRRQRQVALVRLHRRHEHAVGQLACSARRTRPAITCTRSTRYCTSRARRRVAPGRRRARRAAASSAGLDLARRRRPVGDGTPPPRAPST